MSVANTKPRSPSLNFRNNAGLECVFDGPSYDEIARIILQAKDLQLQCFQHLNVLVPAGIPADGKAALNVAEAQSYYSLDNKRGRIIIAACWFAAAVLFALRYLRTPKDR